MLIKDIMIQHRDENKTAVICGDTCLSYKQLYKKSLVISESLSDFCRKSKNTAIFLPNSIEYVLAYFSITLMDHVIVPVNVQAKKLEVVSTMKYCEIETIITNGFYKKLLSEFFCDGDFKVNLFDIEDGTVEEAGNGEFMYQEDAEDFRMEEESTAIMLHTSGTTSNPKRVMLTHKNLISNIKSNILSLNLNERERTLIALNMFFGYCNTAQFLTHLYLKASMVIFEGVFMPMTFFHLVDKYSITSFTGVPAMLFLLLDYKDKSKCNVLSLRYICFGGGPMPLEQQKALSKAFPTISFLQTYGQTEAAPRITLVSPEDAESKMGSVGKPIPNVKVKILNSSGEEAKPHEQGEIYVQGENVMKGYYKNIEETKKVLQNNWLRTGDLGTWDEDGYIYIVGRIKNIIINGGLNVYPEEIEEVLSSNPAVADSLVFGEEDKFWGQKIAAQVVKKEGGQDITQEELINFCVDHLAGYKVPEKIEFVKGFVRTSTGKIKRGQIS